MQPSLYSETVHRGRGAEGKVQGEDYAISDSGGPKIIGKSAMTQSEVGNFRHEAVEEEGSSLPSEQKSRWWPFSFGEWDSDGG